jgi:lysyl-tRNA synthetase, class I
MTVDPTIVKQAKSWPFQEAQRLAERYAKAPPAKGYVLFETGYGPSGLPHSDDMDGLRKVPDNIPNKDMILPYIAQKPANENEQDKIGGVSLTSIPDPYGCHDSFGAHMNAKLREFLDHFGFEYEFKSSTECYKSGLFDKALLAVCRHHEEICNVVRPTLGELRRSHYSPFLPVDAKTNRPLHVDVTIVDADKGIIRYQDPLDSDKWVETLGRTL